VLSLLLLFRVVVVLVAVLLLLHAAGVGAVREVRYAPLAAPLRYFEN
jgi:hypothetical protein